jgi:hypothetical protein
MQKKQRYWINSFRRFEKTASVHLHICRVPQRNFEAEGFCFFFFKTSEAVYPETRRRIADERNPQPNGCKKKIAGS